jgi:hypothetical protein
VLSSSCGASTRDSVGIFPPNNGTPDEWALPVPATYIVDREGTIIYACANVDYRHGDLVGEDGNDLTRVGAVAPKHRRGNHHADQHSHLRGFALSHHLRQGSGTAHGTGR